MSLKTIRDSFHAQVLEARNIERLIMSDDFCLAYNAASKLDKKDMEDAIQRLDRKALKIHMNRQMLKLTPFHRMRLKQLREIGRNMRIHEYWILNKATLIEEIQDAVKRLKESSE